MTKATKHLRNRMRLFTGIGVLALLASVCGSTAAAASYSAAKGKPYTLSVVEDLSGADAQNGQPQLAAAKAAVWQINHTGGINGHPLTITSVQDSQSTEAGAETALRTALGNQTNFTTSSFAGGIAAGTNALYTSAGIPYVGDTYPSPTTLNEPWYFTLAPTAQQVAAGAVNALKAASGGSLKGKVIGFEGFNDPVVIGNLNAAKNLITADGGKIGPTILDPLTVTSWTSQAANVASDHVGGFIINTTEADTAVVGKALVVAGVTVPIVSTEGASSDSLFKAVGASNFYAVRETSQAAVSAGTVPGKCGEEGRIRLGKHGLPSLREDVRCDLRCLRGTQEVRLSVLVFQFRDSLGEAWTVHAAEWTCSLVRSISLSSSSRGPHHGGGVRMERFARRCRSQGCAFRSEVGKGSSYTLSGCGSSHSGCTTRPDTSP